MTAGVNYSLLENQTDTRGMRVIGFLNESMNVLSNADSYQGDRPSSSNSKSRSIGLAASVNYNYDNMADQEDYSLKIFADAKQYFAGTAFHNYGGNRSELLDVQSKAPDMELVFTETSIGTWNQGRDLSLALTRDMAEVGLGTVNNGCKAVIVWNLVLDSERGPHGGPGACATCFGAVDVDNRTYSEITRNSHYYLLAHLASVVKPGATRIAASGVGEDGVSYSAFENTDGTLAFVLCNDKDEARRFTVTDGSHSFTYEIPAKSVASFRWKK